jgi:RNA polymerase sigma factor (sigma-70 family)
MRTEDGYIISKCLNGEPETFGLLVDKYKAGIYAFVYTKLHNFHDAEDVTQEIFIKAFKNMKNLRRWDSFLQWLYSIAYNACNEWIRMQSKRLDNNFIADQDPETIEKIMETPSLDNYHEDTMIDSLNESLDALPEMYREVLTLYYLGGMNSEEIAKSLGKSPTSIRQQLSRARAELREEIFTMISATYKQQKLQATFTFRIVESVKQIKMNSNPMIKGIPWGLSLATGLIFTILSFNSHFMPFDLFGSYKSATLISESKVLKVGEIPVDISKISSLAFLSGKQGNGNGEKIKNSDQQSAFLAPKAEGDQWTKRTDMPTGRQYVSCSAVNGKVYAIGGWGFFAVYSRVEEYDPTTDKWTQKADMLTQRGAVSTCVANGKIYAIGGMEAAILSTVEEYDPILDMWTKKADMPTARWAFSTAVVNGKIYAIGGATGAQSVGDATRPSNPTSSLEEYDPATDTWTKKGDMPLAFAGSAATVVNDKIYVIGGAESVLKPMFSTVWEYDPAKDTWTKKADMPTARAFLAAAVANGRIYAIGGAKSLAERSTSTVEEYDPVTDTWTTKADMPTARSTMGADTVNDKIYVVGGSAGGFTFLSAMEEYNPGVIIQSDPKSIDAKGKLPSTWGQRKQSNMR